MVLSEAEAEAHLAALRRQREVLDRAIADLSLYLELGRRLTGGVPSVEPSTAPAATDMPSQPVPDVAGRTGPHEALRRMPTTDHEQPVSRPAQPNPGLSVGDARSAATMQGLTESSPVFGSIEPRSMDNALSEAVRARRYGRTLIEASLSALEEADRPLHAGEILAVLASRGFSLPGHDPVAALNTRLWKRSGPGGPLKRMGDAVYALAEPQNGAAAR